jgi:hypothetical protein
MPLFSIGRGEDVVIVIGGEIEISSRSSLPPPSR